MKLTFFLLTAAFLQVSATGVSQTITYKAQNVPLETVFAEIKKQTGFLFFYTSEDLAATKPVTIQLRNAPVNEALKLLMSDQPLTYIIRSNTVFIRSNITALPPPVDRPQMPPPVDVSGRVVNEAGEPVAASITVKGSSNGTSTTGDGYFVLHSVAENATLVISGVNIETREIKLAGRRELGSITVKTKIQLEGEVVINAGYYKTTARTKTGNISIVTAADIEKQPVTSPLLALQGRVPGVEVTPTAGVPGAAVKIRVRGQNSLRFDGNMPLYVVDGVPVESKPIVGSSTTMAVAGFDPLSTLNPANIESIEILKDADATAIYGSRGANGVILITTKQASRGDRTNVELAAYLGVAEPAKKMKLLSREQYLDMRRETFKNDGDAPGTWYPDFDLVKWDTTRYTDWQEELVGNTAHITDLRGSVSGGTGNTIFRLHGAYHKETLILPQDFAYQRASASLSVSHHSANQKLRATLTANFGTDKNNLVAGFDYGSMYAIAMQLPPVAPKLYTDDGQLNWENNTFQNPLAQLRNTYDVYNTNLVTNTGISYELLPGLTIRTNLGYNIYNGWDKSKNPLSSRSPNVVQWYTGAVSVSTQRRSGYAVEPQLTYVRTFGKSRLDAVAGASWQENKGFSEMQVGWGYTTDALLDNLKAAPNLRAELYANNTYRYNAAFGRIGYEYDGRYFINLTGRRDGSSRFGFNNRYGNFGAVGAAWIFSGEKFFQHQLPVISFGKIRGSYGTTGSDNIGDYQYYNTYDVGAIGYGGALSLRPSGLYNPDFAWELTRKLELALELGFFKDRLQFELSWYRNRSSNQLVGYTLPGTTGFANVNGNFPATVQNAGYELVVRTQNIKTKQLTWTTSFNISIPRNKLVAFPNLEESSYFSALIIGKPISISRAYHFTGVDPATGYYSFEDVNKDGFLTFDEDRTAVVDLSNQLFGGLVNTISWNNLDLSFLVQFGKMKGWMYYASWPGYATNQPQWVMERWQKPGDVSNQQLFSQSFFTPLFDKMNQFNGSDGLLDDASFIRLKTVTLTWNVPSAWAGVLGMKKAGLFLQGTNLITLSGFKSLDPESGGNIPPLRTCTAGVQLNF